jgi:predicted metal-binding protein
MGFRQNAELIANVMCARGCEADGMKLENCPAYIREWMEKEKD